jgi:hypothetical protein
MLAESRGAAIISVLVVGFSIELPSGLSYLSIVRFLH